MRKPILVLSVVLMGCSTPAIKDEFAFNQRPQDAFDCAISAARSMGWGIDTSDAAAGVFSANTMAPIAGGFLGSSARQYYVTVDKLTKTVTVRVESFNQMSSDAAAANRTLLAEFQSTFKKRCPS